MIPNTQSYQAVFTRISKKTGETFYEDKPVIAWGDDGEVFVVGQYGLVDAQNLDGFDGITEGGGRIIAVIPGGGYTAEYKWKSDGTVFREPIVAWMINEVGCATPMTAGDDGFWSEPRVSPNDGEMTILPPPCSQDAPGDLAVSESCE